ncbi:S-adenosyl-L-methionine-dependent methyltransferase [Conidiobolus coronatus NRRL 28638]|uniref:S-adenosyl-L-methionine-dependent methyltransferase n=1 Tax=Conidiobolus coronatus (strain ATCC 28846 / CBS 209.66 / NRRL 28638) TaxID=796925 RepID=A0A137P7F6_CONC2|nr:S-adenosyl-L-methionine-dependent methyltransferase [Conidiobolus coronatus NRRL 28638]|eukprot:KXN70925.1 S-adenosyl-L-methionine-dependent methyltransferase [Conidiobolus coronatus NRRL 28638]
MIPTPDTDHLDFDQIYEPAEDTFALLDALENDYEYLNSIKPAICLEIGTGSGCVVSFLGKILDSIKPLFLTTDINPLANAGSLSTAKRNNVNIDSITCDLVGPLVKRLENKIDVLIFNPPYVVTPSEEIYSVNTVDVLPKINATWAGGVDGREVIDRLLPMVSKLLSPKGAFYLVTIRENKPKEIIEIMKQYNLDGKEVLKRSAGIEKYSILKFTFAETQV